ncbi:MAG TPA: citrate synthase [Steroidobacteraceae bacterium]|nr:citrate synthase [Steroidobacteraceae bacterium]
MSWLTAHEALQMLGVRPQTLYANVSRKKIRAKPDPKDTRRSLYHEADVRKMARQHGGPRKATAVAAAAIEWGDPILSSAVSTVVEGRLYYRGRDAVGLSEEKAFEEVARILWGVDGVDGGAKLRRQILKIPKSSALLPLQRAFLALGLRAATDLSSYGRASSTLQAEAESVLDTLADAMLDSSATPPRRGQAPQGDALHDRAAANWRRPDAADILRRALVLLADHELNASTFATRVAVSTGAPLAAGVLSGLATLTGPLHGRASLGVLELVAGVHRAGAEVTIRDWLSQGRPIAGFGHPLYPLGDPRATALLQRFPLPAEYAELRDVVAEAIGERPNVDFALAALTKVFNLPQEAPLILFALGRCAGWLAHALEQVTTGHPIRPRARYIGPRIPVSA